MKNCQANIPTWENSNPLSSRTAVLKEQKILKLNGKFSFFSHFLKTSLLDMYLMFMVALVYSKLNMDIF